LFYPPVNIIYSFSNGPAAFILSHHLLNAEKELAYLKKVAELLLVTLLPRSTVTPSVNRNLLIEVFACKGRHQSQTRRILPYAVLPGARLPGDLASAIFTFTHIYVVYSESIVIVRKIDSVFPMTSEVH